MSLNQLILCGHQVLLLGKDSFIQTTPVLDFAYGYLLASCHTTCKQTRNNRGLIFCSQPMDIMKESCVVPRSWGKTSLVGLLDHFSFKRPLFWTNILNQHPAKSLFLYEASFRFSCAAKKSLQRYVHYMERPLKYTILTQRFHHCDFLSTIPLILLWRKEHSSFALPSNPQGKYKEV